MHIDVALLILSEDPNLALLHDGKKETTLHALARKLPRSTDYRKHSVWKTLIGLGIFIVWLESYILFEST